MNISNQLLNFKLTDNIISGFTNIDDNTLSINKDTKELYVISTLYAPTSHTHDYVQKEADKGKVIYRTDSLSSENKFIFNTSAYVCINNQEVERCKKYIAPQLSDAFDSWIRFGLYINGNIQQQYGKDTDYKGNGAPNWTYDIDKNTVIQLCNTNDYTGFVTNETYDDYELIVQLSSNDTSDDDILGVIAGYATDSEGKVHSISFIRSPNNSDVQTYVNGSLSSYHWTCVLDKAGDFFSGEDKTYTDDKNTTYNPKRFGQKLLADGNITRLNEYSAMWGTCGCGTIVRVKRSGNKFYGYTSLFEQNKEQIADEEVSNMISVDLDELYKTTEYSSYLSVLDLFIDQPTRIGVSDISQPLSYYKIKRLVAKVGDIVDVKNNKVFTLNNDSQWIERTDITSINDVTNGQFSYNAITNKCYFNDNENYIKSSSSIDETELQEKINSFGQEVKNEISAYNKQLSTALTTDISQYKTSTTNYVDRLSTDFEDALTDIENSLKDIIG